MIGYRGLTSIIFNLKIRLQYKGEFDVKNVNLTDEPDQNQETTQACDKPELGLTAESTYKDLTESQLRSVIEYLISLNAQLGLLDLPEHKLDNQFINDELSRKNECHQKHMKQISSIVSHVNDLVDPSARCCLVELGAGRGRLSYWYEQSRASAQPPSQTPPNILLIERGSQRLKFDSLIKQTLDETGGELARIRIDLKDLVINNVAVVKKSESCVLYGKHLCGAGTDFALRCLRKSFESDGDRPKLRGIVLAVCCHHQCEWESLCGREFLRSKGIDEMLFYIIRSISSWSTSGDRNITAPTEFVFGHQRQKVGRICKNLIDYARVEYLKSIQLPNGYSIQTKHFYYVEPEVTLENTIIKATIGYSN